MNSSILKKYLHFSDISNTSFVQFQIWDFPGQINFFDSAFDQESIFGGCEALIFVIDAQVCIDGYLSHRVTFVEIKLIYLLH